jgi:hypothetical protein
MDELSKRNLLQFITYSWTDTRCNYEGQTKTFKFKYFNNQIKKLDYSKELSNGVFTHGGLEFPSKHVSHSLFNIIVEESKEKVFISEKTINALYHKRPLLPLCSGLGYIDMLKELDFILNENLIDYSYDKESVPEKKIKMFVDQIEKICSLDNKELFNMTETSTKHNYNQFLKLVKHRPIYEYEMKKLFNMYGYRYMLDKWFDKNEKA